MPNPVVHRWLATLRYQDRTGRVTTELFDFDEFTELGDFLEAFVDWRMLLTCDFVYTGANTEPGE